MEGFKKVENPEENFSCNGVLDVIKGITLLRASHKLSIGAGQTSQGLNDIESSVPEIFVMILKAKEFAEHFDIGRLFEF
eukprot:4707047-Ditylum_brightwellii.AAC.1